MNVQPINSVNANYEINQQKKIETQQKKIEPQKGGNKKIALALGGLAAIGVATVGIAYGVKKGKIRTEKIKQEIEQRFNYITEQENIQNLKLQKNKTMIQKYEALLRKEGLSNQDKIAVYNRLSALRKHGNMISESCIRPDRNKAYYLAQQNASKSVKVINLINELVAQVRKEGVTPATQEKMSGLVKELEKYEGKKFKSIQKAIDYAAKEKNRWLK